MILNNSKKNIKRLILFFAVLSFFSVVATAPNESEYTETPNAGEKHLRKPSLLPDAGSVAPDSAVNLININRAEVTELKTLPGIGAVLALRIVEFRKNYPFKRKEDLLFIRGIGPKRYQRIERLISLN